MSTLSETHNINWLKKQFDENIEPKIKCHLSLSPDEVDLLMEYHEVRDKKELDEAVEAANETGYEAGMESQSDNNYDAVKSDISDQLTSCTERYFESKAAIYAVLKAMMESVIWYRFKHSLDEDEVAHFEVLRKEIVGKSEEDILAYIEDIDKALYDDYVSDIQFDEVEHLYHHVL